jgi:lysozyme
MTISTDGLQMIKNFEGCVLTVYNDAAGLPTIGIGHLIRPGEDFSAGITMDEALALLAQDVAPAEQAVNAGVTFLLSQPQFDACVSLAFNIGATAFSGSTVLRMINAGNLPAAADAFLLWDKITINGVHQVDPGLLARRTKESEAFRS